MDIVSSLILLVIGGLAGVGIAYWLLDNRTSKQKQTKQLTLSQQEEQLERSFQSRMQETIQSLQQEHQNQLQQRTEDLEKTHQAQFDEVRQGIKQEYQQEYETQLQQLTEELENRDSQVQELNQYLVQYETQLTQLTQQLDTSETQVQEMNQALVDYETQLQQLTEKLQESETQIQEMSQYLSQYETMLKQVTEELEGTKAQVREMARRLSKYEEVELPEVLEEVSVAVIVDEAVDVVEEVEQEEPAVIVDEAVDIVEEVEQEEPAAEILSEESTPILTGTVPEELPVLPQSEPLPELPATEEASLLLPEATLEETLQPSLELPQAEETPLILPETATAEPQASEPILVSPVVEEFPQTEQNLIPETELDAVLPAVEPELISSEKSGVIATSPVQFSPTMSVSDLMRYVQHQDAQVRLQLATALSQITASTNSLRDEVQRIIPVLARLIEDPNPQVRQQAVVALGMIKSEKVIPLLQKALRDANQTVVQAASTAIGKFKFYRQRQASKPNKLVLKKPMSTKK